MFLSLFASGVECALMTLEASNVIAMRFQMIAKGDSQGQREAELMVSEKLKAFAQAQTDMMSGVSNLVIRDNLRTIIRANEIRLNALRLAV
jgi:inosine-uridine nucleoside N-ribohydrolase